MLFLDNAYIEFSGIDYLPLLRKYENLVIGRTFSKVHSLAGLRIGYAFVPAWLQPFYLRAGTPFTVNSVSAAAAAAALTDKGHAARYITQVTAWRKRFSDALHLPGPALGCQFCIGRRGTPHQRRGRGEAGHAGRAGTLVQKFYRT